MVLASVRDVCATPGGLTRIVQVLIAKTSTIVLDLGNVWDRINANAAVAGR